MIRLITILFLFPGLNLSHSFCTDKTSSLEGVWISDVKVNEQQINSFPVWSESLKKHLIRELETPLTLKISGDKIKSYIYSSDSEVAHFDLLLKLDNVFVIQIKSEDETDLNKFTVKIAFIDKDEGLWITTMIQNAKPFSERFIRLKSEPKAIE